MNDNARRYQAIRKALDKPYPEQPQGNFARHLNTLAGLISGIVGSQKSDLPEIADKVPDGSKRESRIKRFSRWLQNGNIDAKAYFQPFSSKLLLSLIESMGTLVSAIDGSAAGRGCVCLMVSVIYKKRALPIAWLTVKGKKGHFPEDIHIELVKRVSDMVPKGTDVVFVGDGEFDGTSLLVTIRKPAWEYVCRTGMNITFYIGDEKHKVGDLSKGLEKGKHIGLSGARFTGEKYGPVMSICQWGEDWDEPIYLVTEMNSATTACFYYKKRFKIETFFSDQKSRGFNLHKSHISDPERLSKLMIATCQAYIWIIYSGVLSITRGWDKIIHRTDRCDLQGCSVLPNSLVIKNIFNIHAVAKKLHADIFDFVLSQNIDGKTS